VAPTYDSLASQIYSGNREKSYDRNLYPLDLVCARMMADRVFPVLPRRLRRDYLQLQGTLVMSKTKVMTIKPTTDPFPGHWDFSKMICFMANMGWDAVITKHAKDGLVGLNIKFHPTAEISEILRSSGWPRHYLGIGVFVAAPADYNHE
jgi:hypothetical protein